MKKIILFAIVIIGCVASSFALSLNGFTISKNLATNSVVNISNLNINNTYKFGATEIISAVATGTRDFRNNTASTNTTTDLFRWSYQPDVELGDNNTTVDA